MVACPNIEGLPSPVDHELFESTLRYYYNGEWMSGVLGRYNHSGELLKNGDPWTFEVAWDTEAAEDETLLYLDPTLYCSQPSMGYREGEWYLLEK